MKEKTDFFLNAGSTRVPTRTLDELVSAYQNQSSSSEWPQLLKLDVQGYELEALKGASAVLRNVELLILETTLFQYNAGAPLIGEVMATLDCLGFQVFDMLEDHYKADFLLQLDFVFVRKGSSLIEKAHSELGLTPPNSD